MGGTAEREQQQMLWRMVSPLAPASPLSHTENGTSEAAVLRRYFVTKVLFVLGSFISNTIIFSLFSNI